MPPEEGHEVVCHLDDLLADRGMTVAALAEAVGVTPVNISVLKNDRARAIRFSTLTAICEVLQCQVGDLLSVRSVQPTS
ncbi:helix-turn-helix domain-containing protein [Serinicoccus profundi]|uniref:helix-turn-helix domain-containing protein n=1 Tax=Serinicoccus profundi TaxID=1078471 RepID=UPI000255F84C|nr:helix-turn-helix transcriptional regulator [Serinicoccus profundi]